MHITLLQIGKTKHRFFEEAIQEYLKRLKVFADIQIVTLKESVLLAGSRDSSLEIVKKQEANQILSRLPKNNFIVALDERGKRMDSREFAKFLGQQKDFGGGRITFIIGGPYGLGKEVLNKANLTLSFSDFTFTHEMIRVLLLEQIYRAFTILSGKTYHY